MLPSACRYTRISLSTTKWQISRGPCSLSFASSVLLLLLCKNQSFKPLRSRNLDHRTGAFTWTVFIDMSNSDWAQNFVVGLIWKILHTFKYKIRHPKCLLVMAKQIEKHQNNYTHWQHAVRLIMGKWEWISHCKRKVKWQLSNSSWIKYSNIYRK
jgi:hypothetical protein